MSVAIQLAQGPLPLLLASALVAGAALGAAPASSPASGPTQVQFGRQEWTDSARSGRSVPVKIYYPPSADGAFPVIIFSHGLGGSRDGYEYLGRYWAAHGYVSVHLQHIGSDSAVWVGKPDPMAAMRVAAADLSNAINRPLDVRFAIDQLAKLNEEDGPLKGRLDLHKIGVGGHSFGAYTAMMAAGQSFVGPLGGKRSMGDARIRAAVIMSVGVAKGDPDAAYGSITIPCMHMTGTKDVSPLNDTTPEQRRIAFDHSRHAQRYLITFAGADHMVFSGRTREGTLFAGNGDPKKDATCQMLTCQATTAFWDAYLKGDARAKTWLDNGGLAKAVGTKGVVEVKTPDE